MQVVVHNDYFCPGFWDVLSLGRKWALSSQHQHSSTCEISIYCAASVVLQDLKWNLSDFQIFIDFHRFPSYSPRPSTSSKQDLAKPRKTPKHATDVSQNHFPSFLKMLGLCSRLRIYEFLIKQHATVDLASSGSRCQLLFPEPRSSHAERK